MVVPRVLMPLLAVAALEPLAGPAPVAASCAGLQGDALQRCLQGGLRDAGPPKVVFYDAEGKGVAVDRALMTRSMAEVCRAVGRDGLYTAYRREGDRRAGHKWKEVECRAGRIAGLWKEYFPSDDTLTVLSYDESGRAVKQAFYLNGRLLREAPLGRER